MGRESDVVLLSERVAPARDLLTPRRHGFKNALKGTSAGSRIAEAMPLSWSTDGRHKTAQAGVRRRS